jgi:hypothetical protein
MLGLRTAKLTTYEVAAMILQPVSVVETEITAEHFTETDGYISGDEVVTWLAGARVAANAGTKYDNIAEFSAVAANRP